ncbi:hypothetical protein NE236_30785 [Actinoallomurus purpureus]|uniref:hypothetical protein n=1 Tax=Actinoallomurus purpureus TaxID=478114 RepID=UPI002093C504|nr:hypothetical protein [Actinoallomurus purpureus]MCO6009367.1 hypothetical protein [Actinoallomurus purpureus]
MTVTADRPATTPTGRWTRAARIVTEAFAPWLLIIVLFLLVGLHADHLRGLAWAFAGAVCASLAPMAVIVTGVIRRRFSDHHLTAHEDRKVPLIIALVLVTAGIAALAAAGAPRDVVAVEAAMLAGLLVTIPITRVWKISFHTGVAAATTAILTVVYGPWLLLTLPVVVLIGWSRVRLAHHTPAQVIAGAPVGAVAATVAFLLVR